MFFFSGLKHVRKLKFSLHTHLTHIGVGHCYARVLLGSFVFKERDILGYSFDIIYILLVKYCHALKYLQFCFSLYH